MEKIQRMNEIEEQLIRMVPKIKQLQKDIEKCEKHRREARPYMVATLFRIRQTLLSLEKLGLAFRKSSIAYNKVVKDIGF
jgi:hypothetical protein